MCDWIIATMPWLVEHVGGMSLAWQTVLGLGIVAALVLGYYGMGALLGGELTPRRPASTRRNFNRSERRNGLRDFSDYEEYDPEWVDYDKYIEAQKYD